MELKRKHLFKNITILGVLLVLIATGASYLGIQEHDDVYICAGVILCYSYLLGSIPWGYVLVKLFMGKDIRSISSGNTGATNVSRAGKPWMAVATLILDIGKAYVAVWITKKIFTDQPDTLVHLAGLMAFLGHIYPFWLNFKGGKGVACSVGVALVMQPWLGLIYILTLMFILFETRIMSVASMGSALIATISAFWFEGLHLGGLVSIMTLTIIWSHKQNIIRLKKGTEPEVNYFTKK